MATSASKEPAATGATAIQRWSLRAAPAIGTTLGSNVGRFLSMSSNSIEPIGSGRAPAG